MGLLRADALFIGDTLGLGAFAVVGAQAAISVGMPLAVSCLCGMLTATCGGLVRDLSSTHSCLISFRDSLHLARSQPPLAHSW